MLGVQRPGFVVEDFAFGLFGVVLGAGPGLSGGLNEIFAAGRLTLRQRP